MINVIAEVERNSKIAVGDSMEIKLDIKDLRVGDLVVLKSYCSLMDYSRDSPAIFNHMAEVTKLDNGKYVHGKWHHGKGYVRIKEKNIRWRDTLSINERIKKLSESWGPCFKLLDNVK